MSKKTMAQKFVEEFEGNEERDRVFSDLLITASFADVRLPLGLVLIKLEDGSILIGGNGEYSAR